MKNAILAGILLAAGLGMPASAAQFTFDFSTDQPLFGPQTAGSGVLTTADVATKVGSRDGFAVISIVGTVNGSAIAATTGNYGNYFTSGSGFLDGTGLRFFTESGIDVRFFQQSSNNRYRVNTLGAFGSSNFVVATSAAVAPVPEPTIWTTLVLGFAMVGFATRRRTSARATA